MLSGEIRVGIEGFQLMANRSWQNTGKIWAPHVFPVLLDCNFIVDVANGNGLGLRSLKGPGIAAAYMHTSSTPAAGNPNPAVGHLLIVFQDNYNRYLSGFSGIVSPVSGTSLTATVTATSYVIVSLGSATLAQWQAVGVPVGIVPAVGVAFVATATATIGGSAAVQSTLNSNTSSIELIGDPNTTLSSSTTTLQGSLTGSYVLMHFLGPKTFSFTATTNSSTALTAVSSTAGLQVGAVISGAGIPLGTTIAAIPTSTTITLSAAATASASAVPMTSQGYGVVQPVDGSTVGLSFYMSNSSVVVQGE